MSSLELSGVNLCCCKKATKEDWGIKIRKAPKSSTVMLLPPVCLPSIKTWFFPLNHHHSSALHPKTTWRLSPTPAPLLNSVCSTPKTWLKTGKKCCGSRENLHFFKSPPLWCPHGHGWKGCSKAFRRMGAFLGKTVTSEPSDHSTSNVFGDRSKGSWQGTAITEPPLLPVLSSPPASNTQTFSSISLLFSKAGSASGSLSPWIQHCYRHW